jgi:hypothetical protein
MVLPGHKQPGADRATDSNKLNMPVSEISPQRLFSRSLFVGSDFYLIYHVIFPVVPVCVVRALLALHSS